MLDKIERNKSLCVRSIAETRAEQISFYRFLNNERVSQEEIIENQLERYKLSEQEGHLVCISDSTEVSLGSHRGRVKPEGLGYVGRTNGLGFHVHPTLLIEVEQNCQAKIIGYSSIQIWHREEVKETWKNKKYKSLPIEEKESNKWLVSAQESKIRLPKARMLTMIGDREADIYEEFVEVPDERTHLLIRSCQNRLLADGTKLFERLSEAEVCGEYEILIQADKRVGRKKRVARIEVRFREVEIAAPHRYQGAIKCVRVRAIEAREVGFEGKDAVHWRLLTTHEVKDFADALQMIEYYCLRWQIEQMFRVLKRQGLELEATQLESAEAIKKMCLLAIPTALQIMQLVEEREGGQRQLGEAFTAEEKECLKAILPRIEGKTEKQKNPHRQEKLAWGAWIIARLGGWSGYKSDRPAGVITMKNGLKKFNQYYQGYRLAREDVCTR